MVVCGEPILHRIAARLARVPFQKTAYEIFWTLSLKFVSVLTCLFLNPVILMLAYRLIARPPCSFFHKCHFQDLLRLNCSVHNINSKLLEIHGFWVANVGAVS